MVIIVSVIGAAAAVGTSGVAATINIVHFGKVRCRQKIYAPIRLPPFKHADMPPVLVGIACLIGAKYVAVGVGVIRPPAGLISAFNMSIRRGGKTCRLSPYVRHAPAAVHVEETDSARVEIDVNKVRSDDAPARPADVGKRQPPRFMITAIAVVL